MVQLKRGFNHEVPIHIIPGKLMRCIHRQRNSYQKGDIIIPAEILKIDSHVIFVHKTF